MIEPLYASTFLFTCLYASIGICIAGVIFRIVRWFMINTGPASGMPSPGKRMRGALKAIAAASFSPAFFKFFKIFLLDILLQTRIFKTDITRWIMHFCIFFGFVMLVLMHALGGIVTRPLFPEYYPTLDPFQFLRNLFGAVLVLGVGIAVFRRIRYRGPMLITRYPDRYSVVILVLIIVTGFAIESAKMTSETVYNRMAKEFFSGSRPGDDAALQAYWSEEYGTVFAGRRHNASPEQIARGKNINEESCSSCHARAKTAFISLPLAKTIRPAAVSMDKAAADMWLYYIHVFACFIGLAYLPFSKFFHLITDPLSLIVNGISDKKKVNPTAALPRRALELDSCTSCGTCSRYCSVAPVFKVLHNTEILPMHKLRTVRRLSHGKKMDTAELQAVSEGAFICTSCFKCTEVCPAGINLQDQWLSSRELLAEQGFPLPHVWLKDFTASEWSDRLPYQEQSGRHEKDGPEPYYNLIDNSEAFAPCIQCQTCTNVCPVVAARTGRHDAVDITPHKIMNLLRLGLSELALGARMTWDCATCYQCQEHCPQNIKVADIIYELKNRAYASFKKIDRSAKIDNGPGC